MIVEDFVAHRWENATKTPKSRQRAAWQRISDMMHGAGIGVINYSLDDAFDYWMLSDIAKDHAEALETEQND